MMIDFLAGAAAIVAPRWGVPAAMSLGAGRTLLSAVRQRRSKSSAQPSNPQQEVDLSALTAEVPQIALEWNALDISLSTKGGNTKQILKQVSGMAKPGRLTAIMGPSGSGKTSLLNVLAGHVGKNAKLEMTGSVTVNGQASSSSNHRQAYVQQEDAFYSMLSTAETLDLASKLRLPSNMTKEQQAAYVEGVVKMLGLSKTLDTRVGDKKNRGLSGGEKKRLSIACELIGSPSLLFLDEPTTGLDAFAAQQVVSTLKSLADAGHTVVASIHQPRSSIFSLFDDLVLMSEGQLLYCGPASEVLSHMAYLGHTCPANFSAADFVADLIAIDTSSPEAEAQTRARVAALVEAWRAKEHRSVQHIHPSQSKDRNLAADNAKPKVSVLQQLRLLAVRSWRQVTRDKATNTARAMANISSALIFGSVFWRIKRSQSSIQDRLGLLQVSAVNAAMSALVKTVQVFPTERVIMTRERAKGSYSTAAYLASKLTAELPVGAAFPLLFGLVTYPMCGLNPRPDRLLKFLGILTLESFTSSAMGLAVGALAPSTEAASAIGPAVMVIWIVFGGYYVNQSNVPRALRWLPSASLIKNSFQAMCINEFPGLDFDPSASGGGMKTGDDVLEWLAFDKSSINECVVRQSRVLAFYWWSTYCILQSRKNNFQPLKPPPGQKLAEEP